MSSIAAVVIQLLSTSLIVAVATYVLDRRVESARSDFQIAFRKFETLHDRRIDALGAIYADLTTAERHLRWAMAPVQVGSDAKFRDLIDRTGVALQKFSDTRATKSLFLPLETAESLRTMDTKLSNIWHEFYLSHPTLSPESAPYFSKWLENWQSLTENTIPALLAELEVEMRSLLGVEDSKERRTK